MAAAPAAGTGTGTGKGKRKRPLSEDDVYLLLHRYSPGTILTALQEVAQHAKGRRIDWRAVVGKSATGITSAREYQMLWRHFAYHHELDESVHAGDQPLALISGSSREQASGHRVNLDAPVLNSPNEKIVRVPSDRQLAQSHRITNTGPVSNSKQSSHIGPSPDPLDANGPSKKKRKIKTWSKEEDADLAAGVQKYGEGNWEDILHKCNFDNTRTHHQLSQRWALICKRPGPTKPAGAKQSGGASTEERKAALKAFSMAIDMPMPGISVPRSGAHQQSIQHTSTVFGPLIPEVKSAAAPSPAQTPAAVPVPVPMQVPVAIPVPVTVQVQSPLTQRQQAPAQAAPPKVSNASNKTRNNSKKQTARPNPTIGPSSIQAAAIAAGGRIATATTAANFLKVAQSKNAVHIKSQVTGSSKSSTSSKAPIVVAEPGTQLGGAQHLEHPNTSALKSGPSILTTHATEQVHDVSEVAAFNPPGPSAGAHSLETKKALSITPVHASCGSEEKDDDSTFCVVTIDDLFPEDAKQPETVDPKAKQPETVDPKSKQPDIVDRKVEDMVDPKDADMIEFDRFVAAQGGCLNMDHLDKSKAVKSAPGAHGFVGSQKQQLKPVPAVEISSPVSAGAPATGKKTKSHVPHMATPMATGTLRGIVGAVNATAQNKTTVMKAAAAATTGSQIPLPKKQTANTKGNQMPSNAAVGSGVPASSQASTAANGAIKGNPTASSLASTVVNCSTKGNPPASSQASTVVNGASKANPPASQ
ncbi:uncharacterized protein LOC133921996 isoform X2 [Phragmites australis]|uniref:uncharacterized protein LOC133921996 isoform X2 n=1 Tax=Phragmites australis TaxID=29695 RepID=UPI002D78A143|nr:uncharacterized protein LOC133921996 isoform X2 [Phragmites australis]